MIFERLFIEKQLNEKKRKERDLQIQLDQID
jgi:hypothetical protein